jgi:hypothetical protein
LKEIKEVFKNAKEKFDEIKERAIKEMTDEMSAADKKRIATETDEKLKKVERDAYKKVEGKVEKRSSKTKLGLPIRSSKMEKKVENFCGANDLKLI